MTLNYISSRLNSLGDSLDELSYALHHCWDLPALQTSNLVIPNMMGQYASKEEAGLEAAKALRKELIDCAEQLTQRLKYPIEDIVAAIEKEKLGLGSQNLVKIQKAVGIPFPRNKIDLARYYTIRLVIQGIDRQTISEFLDVDPRTVANYFSQAEVRVRLVLKSRLMLATEVAL